MKSWKIVMLLGAIGILGLVIWPMRAEIKQLETETITRTQTQAKKTAEYRRIQDHFTAIKSQEKRHQYIPKKLSQAGFLSEIQRITSEAGFFINRYAFSKAVDQSLNLNQMKAYFVLEGSESKIIRFLQLVEKNPLFMGIETVNLPPENEGKYTIDVALYALYAQ
jgi:hypothetical protein